MRFRMNRLVFNTVGLIRDEFQSLNISFEVKATGDSTLEGDPGQFAQAVLNILINAKDVFLTHGVSHPKISLSMRTEAGKTILTIADNGGGIPNEIMERIFEPYFTTKRPSRRRGTGLYIAKAVIEKKMGGKLRVRNLADGAEFRIELLHVGDDI